VWLSWIIVPAGWIKTGVFSVLSLLIVTYGIPWTYSLYLGDIELNDIQDVQDFERETGQLTVSSYSEYLPVTTDESQLDPNRLVERFEQSDVIPRLLDSDTVTIESAVWNPTSASLTLNSLEAQTLMFDWLYVDGWTAQIDGQTVNVYPNIPQGLVTLDIPQGEFELQISLQPTETQSLSVLISFVGVLGVVGISIIWRYVKGYSNADRLTIDPEWTIFINVVVIGIGVFLFKAVFLDANDTTFKSARFGDLSAEINEIAPLANFENKIDLVDFEWLQNTNSGDFVAIKLYWKLHDLPLDREYSSILRMRDRQGIVIAESSSFQPGGLATNNWVEDHYIADTITLEIPPFTPPLPSYTFDVGLFDSITLEPLSRINLSGNPEGIEFNLEGLDLTSEWLRRDVKGTRKRVPRALTYEPKEVELFFSEPIKGLPDVAGVGDELIFDWTWQKLSSIDQTNYADVHAQLIWRDPSRNIEIGSEVVPLVLDYPTSSWADGEVVTGYHRLIVPANIPAGMYEMGAQLLDKNNIPLDVPVMFWTQMTITEPERILEQPDFELESDIQWDNGLILRGYDFNDGHTRFVWQTEQSITTSLRLFVHVLDGNDLIVAQSDGIPVDWTRPTTSWIPEEFVITAHQFDAPEGEYRIRIGWYDLVTGDRTGVNNSDAMILDEMFKIE